MLQNRLLDYVRYQYDYKSMQRVGKMPDIDLRELIDVFFNTKDLYNLDWRPCCNVTFKVDLNCRKELAPVELLVELLKEQSYKHDDNEDETAPEAHTVQDPSPDLEPKLKMVVRCWYLRSYVHVYKFLIRQ
jgi:hypothetical protein